MWGGRAGEPMTRGLSIGQAAVLPQRATAGHRLGRPPDTARGLPTQRWDLLTGGRLLRADLLPTHLDRHWLADGGRQDLSDLTRRTSVRLRRRPRDRPHEREVWTVVGPPSLTAMKVALSAPELWSRSARVSRSRPVLA